jgi:hypothetical protein
VPAKKYEVVVDAAGSFKAVDASDGRDADAGSFLIRVFSICDQAFLRKPPQRPPKRTHPVSGRVVDANGAAVEGAIVVLDDSCGGEVTKTDRDGRFQMRLRKLTRYSLEIKGPGFLPLIQSDVRIRNDLGNFVVGR